MLKVLGMLLKCTLEFRSHADYVFLQGLKILFD
jgi:hypothetical protein